MHPKNEVAFQSRLNCCNYDGARIGLDHRTGCCCHFWNALRYSYPLPFRTLNSISSLSSQEGLYQITPHRKPRHVRVLQTLDARTYRMFWASNFKVISQRKILVQMRILLIRDHRVTVSNNFLVIFFYFLRFPPRYQLILTSFILFESPRLMDFKNGRFYLKLWCYIMPHSTT